MHAASEDPPVLSICVPTFNRARYLECLLEDLAAGIGELGCSYELLIGDNASQDHTPEVVRRYEDRLAIRYFRRPENVGVYHNIAKLLVAAKGRYVVYLADDDLLIPTELGRYVHYLEENPEVGAVFAPWLIHDRVAAADFGLFYDVAQETTIAAGDHRALFAFLVEGHIFPEIYVARTALAREVTGGANDFAFFYFVQIAAMVARSAVTFGPEPFYRQITRYFDDDQRSQGGIEEVKSSWDRYRGGLEHLLSRFASTLSAEELDWCHRAIDRFTRVRMYVGLRLRTEEGGNWIDNYYIASRLRCIGDDSLLPAPYETYRVNAALEYLLGLQPFYPEHATIVYFLDDPPKFLSQAHGFSSAGLVARADRSSPLPMNTILLVSRERAEGSADFVISEAELLARFP
ncbi:MAG: glycosyltransferase family 2 protein [Mycobacterium sp.]